MKKYIYCLLFLFLLTVCGNSRTVEAYSVTVEADSMYAEVIPPVIMKNVAGMFKKQVRKAMKYYDKYKDADAYTYMKKVPDQYRDFIEVAKKIQDSDKIVICHPFYIYHVAREGGIYSYYFVAERNHKKLCLFTIPVYADDNGETKFNYDSAMDQYFSLDGYIADKTLFYQVGDVYYMETPEKIDVARQLPAGNVMDSPSELAAKEEEQEFYKKNYEEKKGVVFQFLQKIKSGKAIEKSNENIKLDLKDEYTEPEAASDEKSHSNNSDILIYLIAAGAVIICILVVCVIVGRRRRFHKLPAEKNSAKQQ